MAENRTFTDEVLLGLIKSNSGGGGGGTTNYNQLENKPQIGGVTLTGNKTASDLGLVAAETGKGLSTNDYTDADKAIVGGVTAALAGKQGALTAGKYIDIDENNEISVDPVVPNEAFTYLIEEPADYTLHVTKSVDGVVTFEETYIPTTWDVPIDVTLDNAIRIYTSLTGTMFYELVIASDTHDAGFKQNMQWFGRGSWTETFSTVDHSGEKLVIKSEMDTALAGKQDTLTFDNAPTDGSNNPVKSDGIYDALAGKQDIFERISYANWQLLTPQQQAAKPYYIYDYPNSGTVQAANVAYSNTSSGLSATTAQGGIDELASEKQDATDNNLTTTNKTVVGGINELKSGLTNVESKLTQYSVGTIDFGTDNYVNSSGTYIKKNNGVKMLQMAISSTSEIIPTGDWVTVLTLPTDYAPLNDVTDNRVNTDGHYFAVTITTAGEVKIYNYASNTKIDGSYLIVFI